MSDEELPGANCDREIDCEQCKHWADDLFMCTVDFQEDEPNEDEDLFFDYDWE